MYLLGLISTGSLSRERLAEGPVAQLPLTQGWDGYCLNLLHLPSLSTQHDAMAQDVATLDDRLETFWELESFGVPESDRSVYDRDSPVQGW